MRERPLRVAHVTLGLEMGGLEKLLVEFARHADRSRFQLRFVSLSTRGQLAGEIETCGWPVTALEEPDGLRPGLTLRLAQLFRSCKIDVVHTHDDKPLIYGAPGARLARVPRVVHTRHGKSFGITRRQIAMVRMAGSLTDAVVCVSKDCADLTIEQGLAVNRVRTVWNGIDVARFAYRGPKTGGPAVIVARMSPEKDVETLIRAAALAAREESSFRLVVAGDGSCLPGLRRLATELGVEQQVQFLGAVRDVPALLAGASLFVLSSISEGISLTLLEAMARGLPVVATQVGGNPEVVVDGQTGLLIPPRAPAKLAWAMLRLWRDPEEGRRLGGAGRQRAESQFDVRRMVAAYEALYLEHRHEAKARCRNTVGV